MRINELTDLITKLRKLLQIGVTVKNGYVIKNSELFMREFGEFRTGPPRRRRYIKESNPDLVFVPSYFREIIYELARDRKH